jgi:hypothetical protein
MTIASFSFSVAIPVFAVKSCLRARSHAEPSLDCPSLELDVHQALKHDMEKAPGDRRQHERMEPAYFALML